MKVQLDTATSVEAPILGNLLELYQHDLSEVFAVEPGADGRFGYDKLPLYWTDPARFAFLIRRDGHLTGCILATRGSPASPDPDVYDIAEFFVLRRHRRSGVGQRAAFLLWDRLRGSWMVRVAIANRGAIPFWSTVIADYTRGDFQESDRDGAWKVFSFRSNRHD